MENIIDYFINDLSKFTFDIYGWTPSFSWNTISNPGWSMVFYIVFYIKYSMNKHSIIFKLK